MMIKPRPRLVATAALVALGVLGLGSPAWAHVTVNPNTATQGGYAKLTFRVPTESDTASTTALQVSFPTDQPLASVSVKPKAGWTYKVTYTKLDNPIQNDDGSVTEAVSEIDWTADSPDAAIKPGEFDEFDVSAGPLPKTSELVFKAVQTYSDGSVVRWIEPRVAGQEEPEHPAPVLTLTAADASSSGSDTHDAADTTTAGGSGSSSDTGRSNTALVLSIVALVIAVGGVGFSLLKRKGA